MSIFDAMYAVEMRVAHLTHALGDAVPGSASGDSSFARALAGARAGPAYAPAAPAAFDGIIEREAARSGVDPALVRAVIANESGFDPSATSSCGAAGLMQLMPGTARSLGVHDPYAPVENVGGGARYLRGLLDRFGGDVRLAVAAYNAGPGAVERYGGVPPYAETQAYVRKVLASYADYARSAGASTPLQ